MFLACAPSNPCKYSKRGASGPCPADDITPHHLHHPFPITTNCNISAIERLASEVYARLSTPFDLVISNGADLSAITCRIISSPRFLTWHAIMVWMVFMPGLGITFGRSKCKSCSEFLPFNLSASHRDVNIPTMIPGRMFDLRGTVGYQDSNVELCWMLIVNIIQRASLAYSPTEFTICPASLSNN